MDLKPPRPDELDQELTALATQYVDGVEVYKRVSEGRTILFVRLGTDAVITPISRIGDWSTEIMTVGMMLAELHALQHGEHRAHLQKVGSLADTES